MRLVDAYSGGDIQSAIARLARWPRENVKEGSRAMTVAGQIRAGAPDRLRPAIMLHTDLAAAVIGTDAELADFHVDLARGLVSLLYARKDQSVGAQEFVKRWYEFTPSVYMAAGNFTRATLLVQEGLARSKDDAVLYFYVGAIAELGGVLPTVVVARGRTLGGGAGPIGRQLQAAADAYRRALTLDEHLAIARLHLGWVHDQQHDSRAATEIEAALADASNVETRYLGHLFLGAIAERDRRLPEAMRHYEEAQTIGPLYQTGYIALAHIADMLGDADRAQYAALAFAHIDKHEDPWWDYHLGGVNVGSLEWLRRAVRQ